jgi:hypothetical protein
MTSSTLRGTWSQESGTCGFRPCSRFNVNVAVRAEHEQAASGARDASPIGSNLFCERKDMKDDNVMSEGNPRSLNVSNGCSAILVVVRVQRDTGMKVESRWWAPKVFHKSVHTSIRLV